MSAKPSEYGIGERGLGLDLGDCRRDAESSG